MLENHEIKSIFGDKQVIRSYDSSIDVIAQLKITHIKLNAVYFLTKMSKKNPEKMSLDLQTACDSLSESVEYLTKDNLQALNEIFEEGKQNEEVMRNLKNALESKKIKISKI